MSAADREYLAALVGAVADTSDYRETKTDRPYVLKAWTGLSWCWITGLPDDEMACGWYTIEHRTWLAAMRTVRMFWLSEAGMALWRYRTASGTAPVPPTL